MVASIEKIITVLAFIHFLSNWLVLILSGGVSEGAGADYASMNLSLNALLLNLAYLWIMLLLVLRWRKTLFYVLKGWVILPIIAVVLASYFWSYIPDQTLRGIFHLLGTTLFGLYLGSNYSIKEQTKFLGNIYLIILALSLFYIVFLPRYGIESGVHAGAWRGVFVHKNGFGRIVALGIPLLFMSGIKQPLLYGALGLSTLAVVMSRSAGSIIIALTLLIGLYAYRVFRLNYVLMFLSLSFLTILGLALSVLFMQDSGLALGILSFLGKDPTLTGRTDLWLLVWQMIQSRLWLGYGFQGFWDGLNGPSAYVIQAIGWEAPHSHNGWLDLWLYLGLLGILTFSVCLGVNLFRSIQWARIPSGIDGLWPLVFLTFMLISSTSESGLLDGFVWTFFVAISFSMFKPKIA